MATENQYHDYLQDFLQTKSSLQAGKAEQNLNKRVNFELHDGSFRIMTNAEFIQYSLEKQLRIAASPEKKLIDENKAERINRAFANGNYYIIVRNLGSLYKETPEMKNLEQVMKTPWSPENSAEHFRAEKAAINSIINTNTPTKMYYHVHMNDKGASMPISKTMYDYGMFIQQQLVDELYPKVMDFLARPKVRNTKNMNQKSSTIHTQASSWEMKTRKRFSSKITSFTSQKKYKKTKSKTALSASFLSTTN